MILQRLLLWGWVCVLLPFVLLFYLFLRTDACACYCIQQQPTILARLFRGTCSLLKRGSLLIRRCYQLSTDIHYNMTDKKMRLHVKNIHLTKSDIVCYNVSVPKFPAQFPWQKYHLFYKRQTSDETIISHSTCSTSVVDTCWGNT